MASEPPSHLFAIIITAIDETWSLKKTVELVLAENADDIAEIAIAIAPHTTQGCRAVIDDMVATNPQLVRCLEQRELQGVGGALRECSATIDAPWTIFMSADLETPPESVKFIIQRAKAGDIDIVATSRWIKGGAFGDYNRVKLVCNWLFQKFFSLLYLTSLTDMTYGFRAYRTDILKNCRWRETGMAFFMESICKPLRLGLNVAEVPVRWQKRQEGVSHIRAYDFLRYFRIGLAVRFSRQSGFASQGRTAEAEK